MALRSDSVATPPVGLWGELSSSSFVRGVTAAAAASTSPTGTTCSRAPAMATAAG